MESLGAIRRVSMGEWLLVQAFLSGVEDALLLTVIRYTQSNMFPHQDATTGKYRSRCEAVLNATVRLQA
jgi:hypothetical protein